MNLNTLRRALDDLARSVGEHNVTQVVVIGRKTATVSCTIPDGVVPIGWRRVNENAQQRVDNYQRIVYARGDGSTNEVT
jgi:hypothetical protein